MTIKELIENNIAYNGFAHVTLRGLGAYKGKTIDEYIGSFCYQYGEIIPDDSDSYSVEEEIEFYEWHDMELTVWEKVVFRSGEELDEYLKQIREGATQNGEEKNVQA